MATSPVITASSQLFLREGASKVFQQDSVEKNAIFRSGALVRNAFLEDFLSSVGNTTFSLPSWRQLDGDTARVGTESIPAAYTGGTADPDPWSTAMDTEVAVALRRNGSWLFSDLGAELSATKDPIGHIFSLTEEWLTKAYQKSVIAAIKGVFADNDAAPDASEHVAGDLTIDISGASGDAAKFSAEAIIDAQTLMLDNANDLTIMMVHPLVLAKMRKNNLLDTVFDSEGRTIQSFQGCTVVSDKDMPYTGSGATAVYDTWLFGTVQFSLALCFLGSFMKRSVIQVLVTVKVLIPFIFVVLGVYIQRDINMQELHHRADLAMRLLLTI